jgi:enoyl-[acyl-carrier-protein] reductase (NADH)
MGSEEAAWATLGGTDPADAAPDRSTFATDVAQTVVFLCSRDAGGLTGTDLAADAGYMA